MYRIDDSLKEFLESQVAAQAGTADTSGRPSIVNAWGPRVNPDGTVSVFFDTRRAGQPLANLATNPRIADVFGDQISYRSVQLKGRWLATAAATDAEYAWVQRHRELFASATVLVGDSPDSVRNTWGEEVTRVDFAPESAFDQTPGPNAGVPL
jgi:predicted pyridoxine 5'-phosphate oxidase superfamily flavin-nucleotide-binding protein